MFNHFRKTKINRDNPTELDRSNPPLLVSDPQKAAELAKEFAALEAKRLAEEGELRAAGKAIPQYFPPRGRSGGGPIVEGGHVGN